MIIEKKTWPTYFNLVKSRKKKFELRLADFKCKRGDTLILREWDPKNKSYTGRRIRRKVKNVIKLNLLKFYKINDLKKRGIYVIEI